MRGERKLLQKCGCCYSVLGISKAKEKHAWKKEVKEEMTTEVEEKIKHWCEVCGLEEMLTASEAYSAGWDFPPKMGVWGVVSPRTCGNCSIHLTAWWQLAAENVTHEDLSDKHKATVKRILSEVGSV